MTQKCAGNSMDIKNTAAIITGSATGIGAATAQGLAARGCSVVINYTKSKDEAEATVEVCRELGGQAIAFCADVSKDDDCQAMAAAAMEHFGRLDILVNSAGTTKFVPLHDLDGLNADDFQRIYGVNVIGPFQMAKACAPHLKASGNGAIVNVSSTAGVFGSGSSIAYGASKGALNTMTKSIDRALAPEIRVNAVCPGFVQTRWMRNHLGEEKYAAHIARWEDTAPLEKAATPEEVADIVISFIEGADIVTGQIMVCDAGASLGGRKR
jgi:3-oxoacyl-[acyl-carrier protein] reductase